MGIPLKTCVFKLGLIYLTVTRGGTGKYVCGFLSKFVYIRLAKTTANWKGGTTPRPKVRWGFSKSPWPFGKGVWPVHMYIRNCPRDYHTQSHHTYGFILINYANKHFSRKILLNVYLIFCLRTSLKYRTNYWILINCYGNQVNIFSILCIRSLNSWIILEEGSSNFDSSFMGNVYIIFAKFQISVHTYKIFEINTIYVKIKQENRLHIHIFHMGKN